MEKPRRGEGEPANQAALPERTRRVGEGVTHEVWGAGADEGVRGRAERGVEGVRTRKDGGVGIRPYKGGPAAAAVEGAVCD